MPSPECAFFSYKLHVWNHFYSYACTALLGISRLISLGVGFLLCGGALMFPAYQAGLFILSAVLLPIGLFDVLDPFIEVLLIQIYIAGLASGIYGLTSLVSCNTALYVIRDLYMFF